MNYKNKRWKRVRAAAMKRAEHKCEECYRAGKLTYQNLHGHHVNPVWERPDLMYNSDNIYICCQEHHNSFEDRSTGVLSKDGEKLRKRINRKYGL